MSSIYITNGIDVCNNRLSIEYASNDIQDTITIKDENGTELIEFIDFIFTCGSIGKTRVLNPFNLDPMLERKRNKQYYLKFNKNKRGGKY